MDLPQVKAAVKAWEKAFKLENKREPTKEDIKKDSGGIGACRPITSRTSLYIGQSYADPAAEQYALYRKLTKLGASSQPPSSSASTSTSTAGPGASGVTQRTPRIIPNSEYPTTPTPPARRSYTQPGRASRTPLSLGETLQPEAGPSKPAPVLGDRKLKRTASKAELSSSPQASTSLGTFLTPRKSRPEAETAPAYSGPILDPNPLNPFLASPSKNRISPFQPSYSSAPAGNGASSFIHASSPRKLKEVLEANSLRNVRARMEGTGASPSKVDITPRTRARKRLRGEAVEDTPGKPTQGVRRKRGQRDAEPLEIVEERGTGEMMFDLEVDMGEEEEEADDEELGETPIKPGQWGFTELIPETRGVAESSAAAGKKAPKAMLNAAISAAAGANGKGKAKAKDQVKGGKGKKEDARQMKMNTFFQRAPKPKSSDPIVSNGNGSAHTPADPATFSAQDIPPPSPPYAGPSRPPSVSPPPANADAWDTAPDSDPVERLPTPPPDPEMELLAAAPVQTAPSPPRRRTIKRITANSDDDDGEGSAMDREIVITSTRAAIHPRRRRGSLDSIGSYHSRDSAAAGDSGDDLDPDAMEAEDDPDDNAEAEADATSSLPPHLLSLLSLRSPTKPLAQRTKADLVYKSLFDPEAARRLKAAKRGQDVRVGGVDMVHEEAEGEGAEEEELLRMYAGEEGDEGAGGEGAYADDDWEEEEEGWKRPGEDMDEAW